MAPSRMKLRVRCPGTTSSRNAQPQSEEDEGRRQERHRSTSTRSRGRRKNSRSNRNANNATEASNTTPTTTSANVPSASPLPSSSSSATARQVVAAEDTSPDSKCPICLDRFNNLAYLDRCLHRFCFMCIQEWSHNKAECPLCKQPFTSILHSVRGENDFQKYTISRSPENGSVAATVAMVAAMASDHRMRLTLRRSSTNRSRRNQRMVPVWEWLVDSPPDSPEFIPISPVVNAEETQPFDLAERGIIFEGLTGLGSAGNLPPFVANNRETRKLLFRLAARRRLQREGGRVRPLRDRETIALRRGLYRCGIRVRGIAGSNRDQPQREISVESFCHNPSSLNRLRPWIRRELAVLYGSHDSLITIVQRIILARIARHGLEDLPVVEDELRPFLLARTDHFLHELVSFARSPLTMENYDIQAVYEPPDVAFNVDALDSSTDSSAVIAISEEEEERERGGGERVESVQESQTSLSMTGWDDETPGPSYSMADSSCYLSSFSPALHESSNQDRGETLPQTPVSPRQQGEEELEEECLIVGYKKPIAERTPELVQLSSDSEEEKKGVEEEEDGKGSKEKDGEKEEKEKEGKELTEKQPEKFFPVLTPSPQCREEIVEDAHPSRSHSDCPNPGQSLTEALLRVLGKGCPKSKRKKRERRRNKRLRSSSGTSQNQNSSNVSTPSRRSSRSPSPESSFDSDFRGYSIVSPLDSSCPSTPKSSTTSCFGSSPSVTPPPREKVQRNTEEEEEAAAVAEKPGGKRKYKSRHLDSHIRDPTWRPSGGKGSKNRSKAREMERMRKEEREKRRRRRRRERRRRQREESRSREERSPSVEIVYEGTISSSAPKRKRRRHRNSLLSSPPLVITLDSDSDRGPLLDHSSSACSSPFGSQQTVDFCHFPALPLVHSSGVGGTLEGRDIGELPVDILDRGSEKSDIENRKNKSSDLISLENSSDSNTDIDVEKVETSKTPNREAEEVKDEPETLQLLQDKATSSSSRNNFQEGSEIPHKSHSDDADKKLLDSILSVLDGISTKSDLPSTSNHVKNNILPHKPKNPSVDSFQSMFYPSTLPPFQQLTENRTKFPSDTFSPLEKSNIDADRTDIANEIRSMHNLETHREIASSLLALRDPKNNSIQNSTFPDSLSSQGNRVSSSEIDTTGSTPNSDSLLSNLNEKTQNDLVREKVCSDSRADLDIRKYNSTNAEDVK
ncbi:E3 ubiquitin-protein ligase Topors-like [Periophthalmus magnuspinnatus]|uniref:E3 ubiquitin-protein ligase Topors-like n=1 Tax=Periophthalmus magnuspinnatus TaxID=409849 RepID=UPI00145A5DE7|nr:E3 ubiquitin-protein ligase Topors-like [Periophthalmus magnuspinnatus]